MILSGIVCKNIISGSTRMILNSCGQVKFFGVITELLNTI
jgi:hypothetical protein